MRYLIQFADKTTKHLNEDEGKMALAAFVAGRPIMVRGAAFAHHLISAVKPVNREWYEKDYVEKDQRIEQRLSQKQISDGKLLGFTDAKALEQAKGNWTKISAPIR